MKRVKMQLNVLLALSTILPMPGLARAQTAHTTPTTGDEAAAPIAIEAGARYMVNSILPLTVDQISSGGDKKSIALVPNMEFTVLDVSADGQSARIGLDVGDEQEMPSDITVPMSELQAGRLSIIDVEDGLETDDLDLSKEGLFAKRKRRGGMTYCYADVKKTLLKKGICGRYASGSMAFQGFQTLQRECGMKPASTMVPSALPLNSVCVSSGGRPCGGGSHCGHIAVKIGPNTWFGAGYHNSPFLANSRKKGYVPRKPIGCLVPN